MKAQLLSLLAGTALIATVSVAQASEPMALSDSQMDQVTAAARFTAASALGLNVNVMTGVLTAVSATTITFQNP